MPRVHNFKSGQLYQNVGWQRRIYRLTEKIGYWMPELHGWLNVGDCFLILDIVDGKPLNLEDYDFYLKILHKDKISWIGFSCAFDSKAFSSIYHDLK